MAERKNLKVLWQLVSTFEQNHSSQVCLFVRLLPCGTLQGPGIADVNAENEHMSAAALATTNVKCILNRYDRKPYFR